MMHGVLHRPVPGSVSVLVSVLVLHAIPVHSGALALALLLLPSAAALVVSSIPIFE